MLQLGQDLLHLGPKLLGHQPEVDRGKRLADLHRGAAHPAQDPDELMRRLDLLAVRRVLALIGGTGPRQGPTAGGPRRDARGRAGHRDGAS
jgi:hypothetical protein